MNLLASPEKETRKIRIVGQGLAGSVLALLLDDLGYQVVVADDGHQSSSSAVAAGMWNPLSFKKLHASWIADQLIPCAFRIYPRLQQKLGSQFFFPCDLIRIFPDVKSANEWDERSVHPEMKQFIGDDKNKIPGNDFHAPFGFGVVKNAGWLNTKVFLTAARVYFTSKKMLVEGKVDHRQIDQWLREKDIVVQCTGWKMAENAGFDWLPLVKNKGEVLTVSILDYETTDMFNFGKFLIPLGKGVFKLGATYELNPQHLEPTESAKKELLQDLKKSLAHPAVLVQHDTGYRPTVPDRKPLLGFDPDNHRSGVFTGFGSKGVMLIPFFAEMLIRHMCSGEALMKEVDISRYFSRFRS
jgi:glycine/D-amino acid oxidase-like deaminating enzyme